MNPFKSECIYLSHKQLTQHTELPFLAVCDRVMKAFDIESGADLKIQYEIGRREFSKTLKMKRSEWL